MKRNNQGETRRIDPGVRILEGILRLRWGGSVTLQPGSFSTLFLTEVAQSTLPVSIWISFLAGAFTNFSRLPQSFRDSWATPNRLGVLNLQEKQARAKLLGGNSSAQLDQHFCFSTQINPLKSLSLVWVCLLGRVEGRELFTCAANRNGQEFLVGEVKEGLNTPSQN